MGRKYFFTATVYTAIHILYIKCIEVIKIYKII
jgi:hypothetical protein